MYCTSQNLWPLPSHYLTCGKKCASCLFLNYSYLIAVFFWKIHHYSTFVISNPRLPMLCWRCASDFDRYADWHKFVENLISSDGGGLLAVYVGDEEFSTTCTPGTEYVIYGFAYDDLEVRSDISFFRASSLSFSSVSSPSQSNGGKSRRSPSEKRV